MQDARRRPPAGARRPGARIGRARHQAVSGRSRRRTSTMITTESRMQEHPAPGRRHRQMELLEADLVEIEGGRVGAVPGPPPVMMKMTSNSLTASSSRKVRASRISGASCGRVTYAEGLQGADAVEFGRLVDLGRDRRQAGEQDHEHERRPLPDVGDDDRDEVPGGLRQPADRRRRGRAIGSADSRRARTAAAGTATRTGRRSPG